ncbi:alpha/beta fold hydrolase [Cutibacterium acnes]
MVPNAKGAVVIVHGAAEHSGRYDYLAKRLNDAGYSTYRFDHRGHGRSAPIRRQRHPTWPHRRLEQPRQRRAPVRANRPPGKRRQKGVPLRALHG